MRIAVIADVHGNLPALQAAWREIEAAEPELVVSRGDLTYGSLPRETIDFVRALPVPFRFVRGNAERALLEMADGDTDGRRERELWMLEQHTGDDIAFLRTFEPTVTVDGVRFAHGSPQHDEDIVTPITPWARLAPMLAGVDERTVVTAHIHVQFDRTVEGVRSINPGSVGLPYEGRPGAFWALFEDGDVSLRRTEYDVGDTFARYRATSDPMREEMIELLEQPMARDEMIEHAEKLERSG